MKIWQTKIMTNKISALIAFWICCMLVTSCSDSFQEQDDLKNHRIKCIWDNRQDKVFNEPYVIFEAIVYAFRLTQIPDQYNNYTGVTFSLDTEFMDFIVNNVDRISMLWDKRVWIVLKDIAMLWWNKLSNFINMMKTYWLLQYILPEIDRLYYFRHNFEEHPEWAEASWANRVLSHTTAALQEYNGDDYNVLLAILYNDIGKAKTYSFKYDVNNESEPTRHIYTNKDIAGLKLLNEMGIENYYSKETAEIIKFCMENSEKWWNIEAMDKAEALEIVWHKYYDILEEVVRCKDAAKQCDSNPQVKMFLMENQIQKTSNFPKVKSYIKNNLKPKKRKLL